MKKFFIKFLVIGIALLAVWCKNNYKSTEKSIMPLGDTGITVEVPSNYSLEDITAEHEDEDFWGHEHGGDWGITVSHTDKGEFELEEYAQECAKINYAIEAKIASDGNYYFEFEKKNYQWYVAIRQSDENYYLVSFYCKMADWSKYEDDFAEWATTIKLEQK